MSSRTRKNSIHKRAQSLETNFLNDLIGPIHFLQKRKNKQLKIFCLSIMLFLPVQNGYWDEHGVQSEINPTDDKAVYSQSLPMRIHPET